MLQNMRFIRDKIGGKSKQYIETALVTGEIDFDRDKYRIVTSGKTVSGYAADFTDAYKKEMDNILGGIKLNGDGMDVYTKLDWIVSDGYTLHETLEDEMYVDLNNIFFGRGKQKVRIFRFRKDDIKEGDTRELLVSGGKLVKGTTTMALMRSDLMEARNDDIFGRQEYVMDTFGTDLQTAAHMTTMLYNIDGDTFDAMVENLYDFSILVMNRLSFRYSIYDEGWQSKTCAAWLKMTVNTEENEEGKMKVSAPQKCLFEIAGSNKEHHRLLVKMCKNSKPYNVDRTIMLVMAGIGKCIEDVLAENDIDSYRNFVETIGTYGEGATMNIVAAAEFAGVSDKVLEFIFKYGSKDDLIRYMTYTTYNVRTHTAKTKEINGKYINMIYNAAPSKISNALSCSYISRFISCTNFIEDRENREKIITAFIQHITNGKEYRFNICRYVQNIINCNVFDNSRDDLLYDIVSGEWDKKDVDSMLQEEYRAWFTDDKIIKTERMVLDDTVKTEEDICKAITKGLGAKNRYELNHNASITACRRLGRINTGKAHAGKNEMSLQCTLQLPEQASKKILSILNRNKFMSDCQAMADVITHYGYTGTYKNSGICAKIKETDEGYTIDFSDGTNQTTIEIEGIDADRYREQIELADTANTIKEIYENACRIAEKTDEEEAKEKLLSFFNISPDTEKSPDEILAEIISRNGDVEICTLNDGMEADYISNGNGRYLKVPELTKLQRMVRESYCDKYLYGGVLKYNGFNPDCIFKPCITALETGMPCIIPDACCNQNGDVFIGINKLFHSDNLEQVMKSMKMGLSLSYQKYMKYIEMERQEEETGVSAWDDKIDFIEQCVREETVSREHLFNMLYNMHFGDDAEEWVKNLLDGIDECAAMNYEEWCSLENKKE